MALWAGVAVQAEPVAVNVGSSEATLFWQSEVDGWPEVQVYTDAAETQEVTGTLRREAFPLADPPSPYRSAERRKEIRDFRESIRARGLMFIRIGPLAGGETYYLRAGVRDASGTLHTVSGDPVEVTTAPVTGFVADYRKVAFDFEDAADAGSVALLTVDGARSPLLAVVGDASGRPERGVFSLGALVDDATGAPLDPGAGLEFEVAHYTENAAPGTMAVTGGPDADFQVAGLASRTFELTVEVDVAYFEFDPINDQMAGQPFMVRVTARTAENAIASDFEGTVVLSSDGQLITGADPAAFESGVLDAHEVALGTTGDFQLQADDSDTGATGNSNIFAVRTDWENWSSLYGDPELADADLRTQRLSDPDGLGIPALLRYALELDPAQPDPGAVQEIGIDKFEGERFAGITFRRLQYGPDVRYLVQGSDDLESWETLHVVAPGAPEWVTAYDNVSIAERDARFLRVEVIGDRVYDFWKVDGFPVSDLNDPDQSGRDADPGNLGVTNFERYALGMDPTDPDLSRLPSRTTVEVDGRTYNRIAFERLASGADVRYVVEATSDYPNWETLQTFEPGEPRAISVEDSTPVPADGYRIIRVRIEIIIRPVADPI